MATNVDKALQPSDLMIEDGDEIEIELPEEAEIEGADEELQDDGSVVVDFDPPGAGAEEGEPEFGANLAETMDDTELNLLATRLIEHYKDDHRTREPWEKAYRDGLKLLGLNIEKRSEPWAGASGVFHPIWPGPARYEPLLHRCDVGIPRRARERAVPPGYCRSSVQEDVL